MNCPGNFMAQFAAVLPNHIWMEVVDAGRDVVFKHDSRVEDGYIILGDSPGNGIQFDAQKLEQCRVTQRSASAAPSPWGRRRGAGSLGPAARRGVAHRGRWRAGRGRGGVWEAG